MKSCPICKANFNDDNLNFCLNDGASLFSLPEEVETQVISRAGSKNEPLPPNVNANLYNLPTATSNNKANFLLISVLALILLVVIAGIAAYFLVKPTDKISNNQTNQIPKDDNELKEKIANLEKQLQEQKKNPTSTATPIDSTAPKKTPTQINENGKVTARVAQSNDGFLALRTEPNADTGARLLKIPSGAAVEIEDCQVNYQIISGRRGRWCMVSYNGTVGWAFDGWLIY